MSTSHLDQARGHLDAARVTLSTLADIYRQPRRSDTGERVAEAHQNIRYGFKAAEVTALLSIATSLDLLVQGLAQQPVRREVLS